MLASSPMPELRPKRSGIVARRGRRAVRYPNCYAWFVLLASLDLMLTWAVLHLGGLEMNHVADAVIRRWDLPGLVAFKFAIVALVIGICEVVGHRHDATGRRLAEWAVALTSVPVILAVFQLGFVMVVR
jgi:hypothetical protein